MNRSDIYPPRPSAGFVVAMQAHVTVGGIPRREWIIVARWANGECLSVGFTGRPAHCALATPISLAPRHTLFARRNGTLFHLANALPAQVTLAGAFLPAMGTLRLLRDDPALVLLGRACSPLPSIAWRIRATQFPWIGTFIEPPAS